MRAGVPLWSVGVGTRSSPVPKLVSAPLTYYCTLQTNHNGSCSHRSRSLGEPFLGSSDDGSGTDPPASAETCRQHNRKCITCLLPRFSLRDTYWDARLDTDSRHMVADMPVESFFPPLWMLCQILSSLRIGAGSRGIFVLRTTEYGIGGCSRLPLRLQRVLIGRFYALGETGSNEGLVIRSAAPASRGNLP